MKPIYTKPKYTKPKLLNLSQGARIAFVRQFRLMSQDEVAGKLGLTEDNKRRTKINCSIY